MLETKSIHRNEDMIDPIHMKVTKKENCEIQLNSNAHIFETTFDIPFIETGAMSMGYGDDAVVELAFTDPKCVKHIAGFINDIPIEVQRYRYPTKNDWVDYYIELSGIVAPGTVHLAIHIEWDN